MYAYIILHISILYIYISIILISINFMVILLDYRPTAIGPSTYTPSKSMPAINKSTFSNESVSAHLPTK